MCTTKLSPTPWTGSPVASINIPELSIATCPFGSHSTRKIAAASAGMVRATCNRSTLIASSLHGSDPDDLVAGVMSGNDLDPANWNTQVRGDQLAHGLVGATVDRCCGRAD